MRQVSITRTETDEFGTFGNLDTGSFECYTLERPSSGDHPCIPAGTYKAVWSNHPTHGWCFEVINVEDRTAILIHSANWYQQLLGCIAPGRSIQVVEGFLRPDFQIKQKGVTSSRDALIGLQADLGTDDFELTISWVNGVSPQNVA